MFRVAYHSASQELLVDGRREDYERFSGTIRQVLASGVESALMVHSTGPVKVSHLVVRQGVPPNRVSYESGHVVFSIAPSLEGQFLSFVSFPADNELPDSPVPYHRHFEHVADGEYVAPNSLPVVFGLEKQ